MSAHPPMNAGDGKIVLTRRRIAVLVAGVLGIAAATVAVTVAVEHRIHLYSHEDHDDHSGHAHDKPEKGEHHDEHGESEHVLPKIKLTGAMIQNAGIEILAAGPGKVSVTVTLPGEVALNAESMAHVTPRVPGTVREVKKMLGDIVKKGDVLAILDSRELAEMQRELQTAKERLNLAEDNYKRQQALWAEKVAPEKDLAAAKHALAEARIEHRSAAQKLSASAGAGGKGTAYTLIAPLDGTIVEKHVSVGEVLKDDTQAFVIADLSSVWVNVTVYARDLARIQAGQRAQVRAEGIEKPASGTITYLGQVVGEQTRSATARVVLKNPGPEWRPGLFATVQVAVDQGDASVVIAEEAVQTIDGKKVVFVQEGNVFEAHPVKLGRTGIASEDAQQVVEILDGIAAGDRIVSKNSFILKAELGKSEAAHEH